MPGIDLNLDLPSLSDTLSTIVSKLVTAVSTIEDDLAEKVVPAEININSSLSMNGSALTNIGSLQMVSGAVPTTAGAMYYSGGEWFVRDATGLIQLTANGALNAASVGGIVGDYGGVNPAKVTYVDASGEYQFTEETGVFADLVCDDVVLKSATAGGSVRIGVDSTISTAKQIQIKSLPASGTGMLVYNSATSTLEDGSATTLTALGVTTLTVTNPIKHSDFTRQVPIIPGDTSSTTGTFTITVWKFVKTGAGNTNWIAPLVVDVGEKVKTVTVESISGATFTVNVRKYELGTVVSTGTNSGSGTVTTTAPTTGGVLGQNYATYDVQVTSTNAGMEIDRVTFTFERT
jgi:hypothetical protein